MVQPASGMRPAAQKPAGRARSQAGSPAPRSSTSMSSHGVLRAAAELAEVPVAVYQRAGRSGEPARHAVSESGRRAADDMVVVLTQGVGGAPHPLRPPVRRPVGRGFAMQPGQQLPGLGPWQRIRVAVQRFPPTAIGSATDCRLRSGMTARGESSEPDPAAVRSRVASMRGFVPGRCSLHTTSPRRRSPHRRGSAPFDRISDAAAATG